MGTSEDEGMVMRLVELFVENKEDYKERCWKGCFSIMHRPTIRTSKWNYMILFCINSKNIYSLERINNLRQPLSKRALWDNDALNQEPNSTSNSICIRFYIDKGAPLWIHSASGLCAAAFPHYELVLLEKFSLTAKWICENAPTVRSTCFTILLLISKQMDDTQECINHHHGISILSFAAAAAHTNSNLQKKKKKMQRINGWLDMKTYELSRATVQFQCLHGSLASPTTQARCFAVKTI